MPVVIALLRGINVGGHGKINMEDAASDLHPRSDSEIRKPLFKAGMLSLAPPSPKSPNSRTASNPPSRSSLAFGLR